jgi:drug/metabolite transporter (DMT)-like permease
MTTNHDTNPPRFLVQGAFAAIYLVWGSTYLAVRYAIETMPPFLMFGSRCLVAGAILYAVTRARGIPKPTAAQWQSATGIGCLLIFVASGWISWAEKYVPSSIAALIVAALPMWMVLFDRKNNRPSRATLFGLAIGFLGVSVLVVNGRDYDNQPLPLFPVAICVVATLAWAWGSLLSKRADKPDSPFMTVALQMLTGGAITMVAGLVIGEWPEMEFSAISQRSFLAWCYLLVFGSLITFTSYIWLLTVSTPAKVSTYAFVNPPIAVALGCTIGGEPFSGEILAATGLIVLAVVLIIHQRAPAKALATDTDPIEEPA